MRFFGKDVAERTSPTEMSLTQRSVAAYALQDSGIRLVEEGIKELRAAAALHADAAYQTRVESDQMATYAGLHSRYAEATERTAVILEGFLADEGYYDEEEN